MVLREHVKDSVILLLRIYLQNTKALTQKDILISIFRGIIYHGQEMETTNLPTDRLIKIWLHLLRHNNFIRNRETKQKNYRKQNKTKRILDP